MSFSRTPSPRSRLLGPTPIYYYIRFTLHFREDRSRSTKVSAPPDPIWSKVAAGPTTAGPTSAGLTAAGTGGSTTNINRRAA